MRILNLFIFLVFSFQFAQAADQDCIDWFKESKIGAGEKCFLQCASLKIDMSTFHCPNQCDDLCKVSTKESYVFSLTELYPGLTTEERALASQFPTKSLKAYQLSWKSEEICSKVYPTTRTNDESDACRHFIWAALLTNEIDPAFADQILNAHEQEPRQPESEKAMDLANNRRGMAVAEKLIKDKKYDESKLIDLFKDDLKQGRLVILKK